MKKIVIYPGRFQPMLPHHANVFQHLQSQFPGADVYIATSDKVEGTRSAFNFNEKATIMSQMHGIPAEKIIQAKVPYLIDSYKTQFDQENNMVIFAVGDKDADRFPMSNIDDSTGLDMTVRGEPRAKYYQMINTLEQHPPLPMSERGYVYNSPTFSNDGEVASASAFRNAFISAPDEGSRKEIFTKYMGGYNNNIYALFVNKLLDNKMKTENAYNLDVVKYLSGLLNEAPINFDDFRDESDPDIDDYKPGFKQDGMINQLGKIIDSDDAGKDVDAMKVKKFSPKTTVKTDDDDTVEITPAEAKALKGMMEMLTSARMGEEQSAREKFLNTIQTTVGLKSMVDFAKSKGLVEEETKILPQIDLSDIRDDYQAPVTSSVKEGTMIGGLMRYEDQTDEEYIEALNLYAEFHKEPRPANEETIQMVSTFLSDDELFDNLNDAEDRSDEDVRELVDNRLEELGGLDPDLAKQSGLFDESEYQESTDINDLRKRAGLEEPETTDEAVAPGEYSYTLEYNGESSGYAVHKLTITSPEGETKEVADDFTYFDDDEGEMQDQLASWFNHGHGIGDSPDGYQNDPSIPQEGLEKESFDPMNEPTKYDAAMEVYDNGDESALAEYLGMSDMEFDQELNEYAREHGLHADDDRGEAISGMVEYLLDNADDKYSHQYEDKETQKEKPKKVTKISDLVKDLSGKSTKLKDFGKGIFKLESDSVQEGALKDVIIDAQSMDKEEFDNIYGGSFDYDEINAQYPIEDYNDSFRSGPDDQTNEEAEIGDDAGYASDILYVRPDGEEENIDFDGYDDVSVTHSEEDLKKFQQKYNIEGRVIAVDVDASGWAPHLQDGDSTEEYPEGTIAIYWVRPELEEAVEETYKIHKSSLAQLKRLSGI